MNPAAAAVLLSAVASATVVERIAAVINDDILLLSEVEERARPLLAEMATAPTDEAKRRALRDILDRMVDERLISQEATKLQLSVTGEEIERAIDDIKLQNKLTQEQLLEALNASGMPFDQYRDELRRQILRIKVLNVQVRSRVSVTDDEVRRYYDQNMRKAGADVRVRLRQIFVQIPDNAPRALIRERRARAEELLKRVRKGEAFADIARAESDDLLSRSDGGEIGWTGRGVLPPELEEAVSTMQPNDLRGPIYTDRGAYIVELLERKASAARPFEEIREELRAQLAQEEIERQTRAWLVEVRRRSYVDLRL